MLEYPLSSVFFSISVYLSIYLCLFFLVGIISAVLRTWTCWSSYHCCSESCSTIFIRTFRFFSSMLKVSIHINIYAYIKNLLEKESYKSHFVYCTCNALSCFVGMLFCWRYILELVAESLKCFNLLRKGFVFIYFPRLFFLCSCFISFRLYSRQPEKFFFVHLDSVIHVSSVFDSSCFSFSYNIFFLELHPGGKKTFSQTPSNKLGCSRSLWKW